MPFCLNCGKEISGTDKFCPNCGAALESASSSVNNRTSSVADSSVRYGSDNVSSYNQNVSANIWLCILSFLIPIVGWILYFSKKSENRNVAKTYAIWAWIGFAINLAIIVA